jgi:uncharacterized protein (DUF433 family)
MHWELWALNSGNLIGDYDVEADALAAVRMLLADGWSADDLGLGLEYDDGDSGDDDSLPPVRHGAVLAARAAEPPLQIEKHPAVVGGLARIHRTRVPVWIVEQARRLGMSEAEILKAFPTLQIEDVLSAWSYAREHSDEIDRDIQTNEAA